MTRFGSLHVVLCATCAVLCWRAEAFVSFLTRMDVHWLALAFLHKGLPQARRITGRQAATGYSTK